MYIKRLILLISILYVGVSVTAQKNYYLALPPEESEGIPLIVGETDTIYGNTLANIELDSVYSYDYNCDIGVTDGDNFVVTPVSGDVGNHQLIVSIRKAGVSVAKDTTRLSVHQKVTTGTKSIAAWGNSLMSSRFDHEMDTITSILSSVTLNTTGIYTLGGYDHNAISGYHWYRFVNGTNSNLYFTDGFYVDSFFINNSLTVPDYIYVRLGVNDINQHTPDGMTTADLELIMTSLETFVDGFLAYDANLKFIIGLPSYCGTSKALWDADYDATDREDKNDVFIENAKRFHDTLIYTYRHQEYNSRVYLDYASFYLDRANYVDAIHTNDAGSSQLGRGFANTLNAIMDGEAAVSGKYYASPTGNDGNSGTFSSPWLSLEYGATQLSAGDTLFMRGGVYDETSRTHITSASSNNGTSSNPIVVVNYPGETPILDFTNANAVDGIVLESLEYWTFKGITIRDVEQDGDSGVKDGWQPWKCNNIHFIECVAYHIEGAGFVVNDCDTIYITKCDSYENFDPDSPSPGNGADGFQVLDYTTASWTMAYFSQCRSFHNSDDGYGSAGASKVWYDSCWTFANGYDWTGSTSGFSGRGLNVGQNHLASPDSLQHLLRNCLSVYNKSHGYHINSNATAYMARVNYYNCSSYANGGAGFAGNYGDLNDYYAVFYNNNAYPYTGKIGLWDEYQFAMESGLLYVSSNNSWDAAMGVTITASDFVSFPDSSTAINAMKGARDESGNLPDLGDYFQLAQGSDMIDVGTDVGISYNDVAPDLGWLEFVDPGLPPVVGYKLSGGDGKLITGGDGKVLIGR